MAEDKITFSYVWHKDLRPLEWLQYIADSFSGLADLWDEYEPNHFEEEFEYYKEEKPDIGKMEMYEEISHNVGESLLHAYLYDSMDTATEIEHLRGNIVKAFENSVIFPNLLSAIGIIESVMEEAKSTEDDFYYYQYYQISATPEQIVEVFGQRAAKRYDKEKELTVNDYEDAFECIRELLETIEKRQFSQKLRESAWVIKGYCKLKVGSEKYAEIEIQIAKRYEKAYQSYQHAEKKKGGDVTDRQAYNYLKEYGVEGVEDFELPDFETWQRYLRGGRKHYGTQKNIPHAGRIRARSAIKPNQIQSLSEISSQYTEEDK